MSYLARYLSGEKLKERVELIEEIFPYKDLDFDTIAVRGNSGLLLGSILAYKWNKDIIIIRKTEEASHGTGVEGWGINQNILIVDDFIESGNTVRTVCDKVLNHCDSPTIVGIILYSGGDSESFEDDYLVEDNYKIRCWKIKQRQ